MRSAERIVTDGERRWNGGLEADLGITETESTSVELSRACYILCCQQSGRQQHAIEEDGKDRRVAWKQAMFQMWASLSSPNASTHHGHLIRVGSVPKDMVCADSVEHGVLGELVRMNSDTETVETSTKSHHKIRELPCKAATQCWVLTPENGQDPERWWNPCVYCNTSCNSQGVGITKTYID